ncbi:hypothetical protein [Saccharopolyspora shandongensis]|uniref:hypothetical protein n=1 Tax=Saccharopolyspora shandongensis TaxID=418495 RepID=UPI001C4357D7|nr:hypothetical protein [Saccharopolyspora shandongensis]
MDGEDPGVLVEGPETALDEALELRGRPLAGELRRADRAGRGLRRFQADLLRLRDRAGFAQRGRGLLCGLGGLDSGGGFRGVGLA